MRALVRGHGRSVSDCVEIVSGDLGDEAALARLASGAEIVIHNAGVVRAGRPAGFFKVNRDGAARMADAANANMAADGAYVLVSSLAATRPGVSPYAASKAAAEVESRMRLSGRRLAVLRPPAIYGPFDAATKPMFDMIRFGFAPRLGRPSARFAMVHVQDAARAALAAAGAATDRHPVFEFDDGAGGHDWADLRAAAETAAGRRLRLLPVPPWLLKCAAFAAACIARTGLATPFLSVGKAREMLVGDWIADRALRPPDWSPDFSLPSGFSQTLACYRDRRLERGRSDAKSRGQRPDE